MNRKTLLIFLTTLILSYALIKASFKMLSYRQESLDAKQTKIIEETIQDRFKLYMKVALTIGIVGADFFSTRDIYKERLAPATPSFLKINPELLGVSLLNEEGRIIRVYPIKENIDAKGRITQNISSLLESFRGGQEFWLSAPFELYQNNAGFVLYVPIKLRNELKGWYAPVISADRFFDTFKLDQFLESYHLIIKDETTGKNYFASTEEYSNGAKVFESSAELMGRKLIFQSWRKEGLRLFKFPWYWSFLLALVIALVALAIGKLNEQKKRVRNLLKDISVLLDLTYKEALSNLVDIHTAFEEIDPDTLQKNNFTKNVSSITNLIEQINLLQAMAHAKEDVLQENHKFLPLLEKQLHNLEEILGKKNLKINLKHENLKNISISANAFLLQNNVISAILSQIIIYARDGSSVNIDASSTDETHFVTFHALQASTKSSEANARLDRRLEVAQKILHLYQGKLFIQKDLSEGMIIRISFPVQG